MPEPDKSAKRSIFGNYAPPNSADTNPAPPAEQQLPATLSHADAAKLESAVARSFIYRFIAKAYEHPDPDGWHWLSSPVAQSVFRSAVKQLAFGNEPMNSAGESFLNRISGDGFFLFLDEHIQFFGHAARGECPINEMEYGDPHTDPLLQPHRLADLAAFYQAHGLETAVDAGEREDHLCLELEFMAALAAKEGWVLQNGGPEENLARCQEAQRQFLKEHLGRWAPAFARRLMGLSGGGPLADLARFTLVFLSSDCARFGVAPGSDALALRPVDTEAESLCASCGFSGNLPGMAGKSE